MSIVSTVVMIVTDETPWYICQMKQSCCEKWNRGVNSEPINKMDLKEGSNVIRPASNEATDTHVSTVNGRYLATKYAYFV